MSLEGGSLTAVGEREKDDIGAGNGGGVLAATDAGAGDGLGDLGGSLLAPFG